MARADAMGPSDPDFAMKRFTDEIWGDADVRRCVCHHCNTRARAGCWGAGRRTSRWPTSP